MYMKVLLRQESARDYIDALASFSKQPVVIVSDIPSQVDLHHKTECLTQCFSITVP